MQRQSHVFRFFDVVMNGFFFFQPNNLHFDFIYQGCIYFCLLFVVSLLFLSCQARILHRLGICHQVSFTRWFVACFLSHLKQVPAGLRVKDMTFSEVPVRVYEPTSVCDGLRRGLMYFHGGGWILGSIGI